MADELRILERVMRRLAIWSAAILTCAVGTFWALLMTGAGSANYFEHFCGEPGRLPPDLDGYQAPQWVGPTTFRCVYPDHPDLVVTDWTPAVGLGLVSLVTLGAVCGVLWFAHRLSRA